MTRTRTESISRTWLLGLCSAALIASACQTRAAQTQFATAVPATGTTAPTQPPAPSATPIPPTTAATSAPTVTAVLTPTLDPAEAAKWDRYPKDAKGRVAGGKIFPFINYTTTMITGKPCERVLEWKIKEIIAKAYGIVDNPCVVQNAIDDYMVESWYEPYFNNPETMKEVGLAFETDENVKNTNPSRQLTYVAELWKSKKDINYAVCDRPMMRLLRAFTDSPFYPDTRGLITGYRMGFEFLIAAQDLDSFQCEVMSYSTGKPTRKPFAYEESTKTFYINSIVMAWNDSSKHWEQTGSSLDRDRKDFAAIAKEILDQSQFKPKNH